MKKFQKVIAISIVVLFCTCVGFIASCDKNAEVQEADKIEVRISEEEPAMSPPVPGCKTKKSAEIDSTEVLRSPPVPGCKKTK